MKTPQELNQEVIKYHDEQTSEALSHIVNSLLVVEDYIEQATKIGRRYTYLHLEHRNTKPKKVALNIVYDYLVKKGFRVDRPKNTIYWNFE
jgi:hypothetical protein